MEVFHVDEKVFGVLNKAFSVRVDIFTGLEAPDELLELPEYRVAGGGGFGISSASAAAGELRLVAVIYGSFVPTRHLFFSLYTHTLSLSLYLSLSKGEMGRMGGEESLCNGFLAGRIWRESEG